MNIKLKCPHDWRDIEGGAAWSKEVRDNSERLGLKVKHSKYGESFFYTKDGELRGCGYHRFIDCGCDEITLEQLRGIKMTLEQMQKIVDGAPEWADTYLFHGIYADSKIVNCGAVGISLDDLRTELAKREPMDLRDVDIPHGTIVLER